MVARIVISLDFELGWGVCDSDVWKDRENKGVYKRLRKVFPDLLYLLASRELPTTWAAVSSMLIEKDSDLVVDYLPDSYRQAVKEFFKFAQWETRCAVDFFDQWHKLEKFSEIASHTATHIYSSGEGVTSDAYVQDVKLSINTLEQFGCSKIKTLIFPRDLVDYESQVATSCRPMNFRVNPSLNNEKGRLMRVLAGGSRFFQNVPESEIKAGAQGQVYQRGSLYFNWVGGSYQNIKKRVLKKQVKCLLKQLAVGSGTYHIWLHPFNLAESEDLCSLFMLFLSNLADLRDRGLVEVVTMEGVGVNYLESKK